MPGEFCGLYSPGVAKSRTQLSDFHFHFTITWAYFFFFTINDSLLWNSPPDRKLVPVSHNQVFVHIYIFLVHLFPSSSPPPPVLVCLLISDIKKYLLVFYYFYLFIYSFLLTNFMHFQLKDNCFTILCWFLLFINMNQGLFSSPSCFEWASLRNFNSVKVT